MPEDPIEELKQMIKEEQPDSIEVSNFPDIQKVEVINKEDRQEVEKVEVTNWPEQKAPVVNVPPPQVTVNAPEPKVVVSPTDLTELTNLIEAQSDLLRRISEKEAPSFDYTEFERIAKENRSVYRGGAVGPSKQYVMDKAGKAVDPMDRDLELDTSTLLALDNGENWTTGWVDRKGYTGIKVSFKTDQNGYYLIQYSPDGINADSTLTRYYRTNQIEPPHKFENMRKYVKVTFYNNSGSNQTYIRADIALTNSSAALNIPVDGTMSQDYDAISTRPTDFTAEVALGRRQGWTTWNKFGYNLDVDTTTDPEILASWGGTFQYLTAGETLSIVSTSTDDDGDPAGTGANSVVVYGVDSNWDSAIEIVTLDGTTPVTTTTSFIGVNRIAIYLAGSGKTNAGVITATASSSGYTLAQMPVGEGTTQQCIFFVPQNHQFLADWLWLNALKEGPSTAPIVTFRGWVYSAVSNAEYEVFRGSIDTTADTLIEVKPPEPFTIGEKSIFWITAETTQNDTSVRGRFSGKLVSDVDA